MSINRAKVVIQQGLNSGTIHIDGTYPAGSMVMAAVKSDGNYGVHTTLLLGHSGIGLRVFRTDGSAAPQTTAVSVEWVLIGEEL